MAGINGVDDSILSSLNPVHPWFDFSGKVDRSEAERIERAKEDEKDAEQEALRSKTGSQEAPWTPKLQLEDRQAGNGQVKEAIADLKRAGEKLVATGVAPASNEINQKIQDIVFKGDEGAKRPSIETLVQSASDAKESLPQTIPPIRALAEDSLAAGEEYIDSAKRAREALQQASSVADAVAAASRDDLKVDREVKNLQRNRDGLLNALDTTIGMMEESQQVIHLLNDSAAKRTKAVSEMRNLLILLEKYGSRKELDLTQPKNDEESADFQRMLDLRETANGYGAKWEIAGWKSEVERKQYCGQVESAATLLTNQEQSHGMKIQMAFQAFSAITMLASSIASLIATLIEKITRRIDK